MFLKVKKEKVALPQKLGLQVWIELQVRNPPNLDWRELVTSLTSTNTDIKGLHPRLDYLFRIRAWNEYGCSEPSLPVSLHRPIGVYLLLMHSFS